MFLLLMYFSELLPLPVLYNYYIQILKNEKEMRVLSSCACDLASFYSEVFDVLTLDKNLGRDTEATIDVF